MTVVRSLADLTDEATLRATRDLCTRCHVQRLDVFGSVLTDRFDPSRSDLDLLVTFTDLVPRDYADAWFGLKEDLEALAKQIPDLARIVGFRNVLVHGYTSIDDSLVWRVVERDLPGVVITLAGLLSIDSSDCIAS